MVGLRLSFKSDLTRVHESVIWLWDMHGIGLRFGYGLVTKLECTNSFVYRAGFGYECDEWLQPGWHSKKNDCMSLQPNSTLLLLSLSCCYWRIVGHLLHTSDSCRVPSRGGSQNLALRSSGVPYLISSLRAQ